MWKTEREKFIEELENEGIFIEPTEEESERKRRKFYETQVDAWLKEEEERFMEDLERERAEAERNNP